MSDASLLLQDRAGVDVNVMLYLLWRVTVHGQQIENAAVSEADALVVEWRRDVVQPLRAMRRRLKSGPHPAPDSATEKLRGRIKAAEIEAEHIELDALERLVRSHSETNIDIVPLPEARQALELLVSHYDRSGCADTKGAIESLLNALAD